MSEALTSDGGVLDYQTRCATWEEALAMHQAGIAYAEGWMYGTAAV